MKTEMDVIKNRRSRWVSMAALAEIAILSAIGLNGVLSARSPGTALRGAAEENAFPAVDWKAPDPATIPRGPLGESIRLGLNIMTNTPKYASRYVGNRLNCTDCHLNNATQAWSSPLAGITTIFPAYTKRDGRVITIEHRIQECFERSENGTAPPSNSPEMVAIVAYMNWLSKGVPMGSTVKGRGLLRLDAPARLDVAAGASIYAQQCQACHGANGQGVSGMFPPLWGAGAFNDGAGMSHLDKMAAFVKANMPKTSPGSLSVQQAYDVAAFVTSKPRPHFKPPVSPSR